MPGKVVFTAGNPQERKVGAEKDLLDNRLYTNTGDLVLVGERALPSPHIVVYLRGRGSRDGLLATIEEGSPKTGEQLGLPLVGRIEYKGG